MRYTATAFTLVFLGATSILGRHDINIDFRTYKSASSSVSSFLYSHDFSISSYSVDSTPKPHAFKPANVGISNGALTLKVTGGTTDSAEIAMGTNFLYGNITTRAKISSVPGTCAGFFTYKDDNHEQDIELLSSYITMGYQNGAVVPGIQFTNQALVAGQSSTNTAVPYTFDPTSGFHDYTPVWTHGMTRFYIDGALKTTFTKNVPSIASSFILNNWSSGDPMWSAGPPTADNVVEIQSISGYIYPA